MSNQPMNQRTTVIIACFFILVAIIVITVSSLQISRRADEKDSASAALSNDDFEVTEYTYEDAKAGNVYVLVIQNRSTKTVDIACNTNVYDKDGNFLGITYDAIESVAPNGYGCMQFIVDPSFASDAARFECEFDYEVSDSDSQIKSIRTKEKLKGNSVTATVRNAGKKDVHAVRANILFFSGGNPVAYDSSYLAVDDSLDLAPEETARHEFTCDQDFDSYQIYYTCK